MNPQYPGHQHYPQQQPQPQQQQQMMPQTSANLTPATVGEPSFLKKNPMLLIAAGLLGLFVLCGWLVGAFKIDGDAGRIIAHTGMATGTAGLGLLMLFAFHRITEKDKDHPTGVGLGLVICILLVAIVGLGAVLQLK